MTGRWFRLREALVRPRGNAAWDFALRGAGLAGLAGLVLALVGGPGSGLAGFTAFTMLVYGPASPFLPGAHEPALLVMGRLHPPLLVATVGTLATLVVEAFNYRMHERLLEADALSRLREGRLQRWAVRLFQRAPGFAVWVGTWSPLPDWSLRILAPLARYPMPRYLVAMGLGRIPRFWLIAELGRALRVPAWVAGAGLLLSVGIGLGVGARALRRRSAGCVAA